MEHLAIEAGETELEATHEEYVAEDGSVETGKSYDSSGQSDSSLEVTDGELLEKARSASNGEKFDRL